MNSVTKNISKYSIAYIFILITAHFIFFNIKIGFLWTLVGTLLAFWFFNKLPKYEVFYNTLTSKAFVSKIFKTGFFIRLFFMLIIHVETILTTGQYEYIQYVGAVDALGYEYYAKLLVNEILNGQFDIFKFTYNDIANGSFDDTGFYLLLTFAHFFTLNFTILVKILLILLNSYMSVQLYNLSKYFFNEEISRLTAILAMLFPLSFFFGAVYLKTSTITFISLAAILTTLKILHGQFNIRRILQLILLLFIPFTLRTPTAIVLIMTVIVGVLITKGKVSQRKTASTIFIIITVVLTLFAVSRFSSDTYITNRIMSGDEIASAKMAHVSKQITVTKFAGAPLFIGLSIFAPFPNIVTIPNNQGLTHVPDDYLIGGLLVWSVLAAFVILGLIKVIYYQFRRTIILWFFPIVYLIMLANSGYFTSERMQYTSMPILLIFAAYAMSDRQTIRYRIPLLFVSGLLIFGWNYFRLQSRGLL